MVTLGIPSGIGVTTLLWLTPLVALKATTCVIQGVVFSRLMVVYSEEYVASNRITPYKCTGRARHDEHFGAFSSAPGVSTVVLRDAMGWSSGTTQPVTGSTTIDVQYVDVSSFAVSFEEPDLSCLA